MTIAPVNERGNGRAPSSSFWRFAAPPTRVHSITIPQVSAGFQSEKHQFLPLNQSKSACFLYRTSLFLRSLHLLPPISKQQQNSGPSNVKVNYFISFTTQITQIKKHWFAKLHFERILLNKNTLKVFFVPYFQSCTAALLQKLHSSLYVQQSIQVWRWLLRLKDVIWFRSLLLRCHQSERHFDIRLQREARGCGDNWAATTGYP